MGKGCRRRPNDIEEDEFEDRWDAAFGGGQGIATGYCRDLVFRRKEKNGKMKRKPKKYEQKTNS